MKNMQQISDESLAAILGGSDPTVQPLTMPPGWTPVQTTGLPGWVTSIADYLKYLGIIVAR